MNNMPKVIVTIKDIMVFEKLVNEKCIKPTLGLTALQIMDQINPDGVEQMTPSEKKDANYVCKSTLYALLKKHVDAGYIGEGVKLGYKKTYYITTTGVRFYASLVDVSHEDIKSLMESMEQINGKWGNVLEEQAVFN